MPPIGMLVLPRTRARFRHLLFHLPSLQEVLFMRLARLLRGLGLALVVLLLLTLMVVLVSLLAVPVTAIIAIAVALTALVVARLLQRRIAPGTVLEVDLDHGVMEQRMPPPLGPVLQRGAAVVRDVVDALDRAREDDRVIGLIARLGNGQIGLGQAQELRAAVARFGASGKTTVAFAETFGEGRLATVDYYLASAFAQVHLQPLGSVGIGGVVARTPFLRGLLDMIGVFPDLDHRREYKAAKYLFTETGFTEPHAEATSAVLDDHMDQVVSAIAADRSLDEDRVRELINTAPLLAEDALASGLVDALSYRDEAYRAVSGDAKRRVLFVERYLRKAGRPHRRGEVIALIYGIGSIHRGRSRFDPMTRGMSLGADDVADAFREAVDAKKVRAVVFRVDSPGGSAVASEVVRRQVVRAREAGKPVVVSMGNVAGSGGYFVAAPADRIVAQPGTITGSIGVVDGKLVTADAWRRVGVNWGEIHRGDSATYTLPDRQFTDTERDRLEKGLDYIYDGFKDRVARGRSLTPDQVEEVAKGRIWTGARAAELGLVDELGGLDVAIFLARELAGIPEERPVHLKTYPRERRLPRLDRKESSEPIWAILGTAREMLERRPAAELVTPRLHTR